MTSFQLKFGATLAATGTYRTGDPLAPVNLTGYTLAAHVRDGAGVQLAALTATLGDQSTAPGTFTLSATAAVTVLWPPGVYRCDVRFTSAGGWVTFTETFQFVVERAETHA